MYAAVFVSFFFSGLMNFFFINSFVISSTLLLYINHKHFYCYFFVGLLLLLLFVLRSWSTTKSKYFDFRIAKILEYDGVDNDMLTIINWVI